MRDHHIGTLHEALHLSERHELRVLAVDGLVRRVTRLDIDRFIERPVRLEIVNRLDQAVELLLVGAHGYEYHVRPSLEDRAEVDGVLVDIELFWPLHHEEVGHAVEHATGHRGLIHAVEDLHVDAFRPEHLSDQEERHRNRGTGADNQVRTLLAEHLPCENRVLQQVRNVAVRRVVAMVDALPFQKRVRVLLVKGHPEPINRTFPYGSQEPHMRKMPST